MTTQIAQKTKNTDTGFQFTRQRILAIALIVIAAALLVSSFNAFDFEIVTRLTLEPGRGDDIAAIVVPTLAYVTVTGVFFLISGVLGVLDAPNLRRLTVGMMIVSGILLFPTIFIAAAAGSSTNIVTLLTESMRRATPIAIGAMAGIWCERSGVINIAIEGMMLFSAAFAFVVVFTFSDIAAINGVLGLAVVIGVLSGGVIALLHAWLSITFSTDQIVSGTVINILAIGVTSFIRREYLLSAEAGLRTLPTIEIPLLSEIPILGEVLFSGKPIFYLMFVVIIATHIILFNTRWGLRTRAVGENPHAADTLGVKVNRMRWTNVFIGGLIAGLAGAWFTIETTGRFTDNMTNGAGFIALAAMIFGKWTPFGAFGGALLFGFADAMGTQFQIINVPVPQQFLQMVPYIVTIIVLAGLVGRAIPPRAIGQPYKKE